MKNQIAIIFMVAGLSSRFGGKIKQFVKVGLRGETLIEYSLKQAIKTGFTKIIFIVGEKTEKPFKNLFGDNFQGIPIDYSLQEYNPKIRDKPRGTADALCSAKKFIYCPFVVCNGDDIYGENTLKILFNHLNKNNNEEATIGYKLIDGLPEKGEVNRGIFKVKGGYVKKIEEIFNISKKNLNEKSLKPDDLCSMNIFALHPKTLKILNQQSKEFKKKHKGNRKIECLLPNEISKLIESKKMKVYSTIDKWAGITNPEDVEIVRKMIKNKEI